MNAHHGTSVRSFPLQSTSVILMLLIQTRISPVLHSPTQTPAPPLSLTHTMQGESCSDVLRAISYHKRTVAIATAPFVSMATSRHVKVVLAAPLKGKETTTTTNGEQWNSQ